MSGFRLKHYETDKICDLVFVSLAERDARINRLLARAEKLETEVKLPTLSKNQPCGCVICDCVDTDRCFGCGAKNCGTPECVLTGDRRNAVFEDGPSYQQLRAKITQYEEAWDTMRHNILQGSWLPDAGGNVINAALDVIDEYYPEDP